MCVLDFVLAAWCHRQMLHQLHQLLSASSQVSSQDLQDFQRLLWAAHLTCLANQSQQAGLLELAARQLTALLHYIGIVPVDRWAATQGWSWSIQLACAARFNQGPDAVFHAQIHATQMSAAVCKLCAVCVALRTQGFL